MSNKAFMYDYVKSFIYEHVIELGYIIGHNVVCETKHLCMNMSKVCIRTCHRTRFITIN